MRFPHLCGGESIVENHHGWMAGNDDLFQGGLVFVVGDLTRQHQRTVPAGVSI